MKAREYEKLVDGKSPEEIEQLIQDNPEFAAAHESVQKGWKTLGVQISSAVQNMSLPALEEAKAVALAYRASKFPAPVLPPRVEVQILHKLCDIEELLKKVLEKL